MLLPWRNQQKTAITGSHDSENSY